MVEKMRDSDYHRYYGQMISLYVLLANTRSEKMP